MTFLLLDLSIHEKENASVVKIQMLFKYVFKVEIECQTVYDFRVFILFLPEALSALLISYGDYISDLS